MDIIYTTKIHNYILSQFTVLFHTVSYNTSKIIIMSNNMLKV